MFYLISVCVSVKDTFISQIRQYIVNIFVWNVLIIYWWHWCRACLLHWKFRASISACTEVPSEPEFASYICLCIFKASHEANVYCSSVPTGDQSLSYMHCLPRRKSRDWSLERETKDRIGQPEVCTLNYWLVLYSCVDDERYSLAVLFSLEILMRKSEDGLTDIIIPILSRLIEMNLPWGLYR